MKYLFTISLVCSLITFSHAQFKYINPKPGSALHYPQATIILKNGDPIDEESVQDMSLLEIYGSKSGMHQWKARLSDDGKTVVIKPDPIFYYGETVFVTVNSSLRKVNGDKIEGTSFTFSTRNEITPEEKEKFRIARLASIDMEYANNTYQAKEEDMEYPLDSMPTYTILKNNNPAPGKIFYCNHEDDNGTGTVNTNSFPTIIENNGNMIWARDMGDDGVDFKLNYNGYMSYFASGWMIMDSNYNVIDSFKAANGFEESTNVHDFVIYPDGHAFLQTQDYVTTDLTAYGGLPNATVIHLIIQELDSNHDLVFEWRSSDYFQVTDANNYTPITNAVVDYCHGNAIDRDLDGNIIISCRNMNEITKIDHETGNIIWRLGGENNQFTFVNDNISEHFHSQHDVRIIPNGHLTLFNNGNGLPVQISSAKEYALDQVNKIATLVWYYEHPDVNGVKVYGAATGSAQRLPNGNTIIDWGHINASAGIPNFTEVDVNKNIVWEMKFDSVGQKSYRVHKYDWNPCSRITGYTMSAKGNTAKMLLSWGPATGAAKYEVHYRKLNTTAWTVKKIAKTKLAITGLPPMTAYEWRVRTICSKDGAKKSAFSVLDTFKVKQLKYGEAESDPGFDVSIYPVPASDHITVELAEVENAHLRIINTLGLVVYERTIISGDLGTVNVDVNGWPAGMYIVEVESNNQLQARKVLVE